MQHRPEKRQQYYGIGLFETLVTILAYGQRRGEVRADLPLESLARYVGVLYIALLHSALAQATIERYLAEVELLLRFLKSALAS